MNNNSDKNYIAHINDNGEIQTVKEHCINAAKYAREDLCGIGLENTAYLAGILHDCGKFTEEFRNYILDSTKGVENSHKVIHSFAGLYYIMDNEKFKKLSQRSQITIELIALAIASHHGLFDCVDENGQNGFLHRLEKQKDYEKKAIQNYFKEMDNQEEIEHLFELSNDEIEKMIDTIFSMTDQTDETNFYVGMLARLLISAVIDGDRKDTAEFMSNADFSVNKKACSRMWDELLQATENYIASKSRQSAIEIARSELSDKCKNFAKNGTGIYRLNLPTGGGKTLSGLRFALEHAKDYNKSKIIYVAPLISIIEQNSTVIKSAVGDESVVLEHHSNIVMESDNSEKCTQYHLLTETWNSPIIITTLVQFLNTLFNGKTGSVRRFQSLSNSVIIIDEVQTVPNKMLTLFNLAMNFLTEICNVTVLLCSATQPSLEETAHSMKISKKQVLTSEEEKHFAKIFKRTEIIDRGSSGLPEIVSLIKEVSTNNKSVLMVCNTKKEAQNIYSMLEGNDYHINCEIYHLSAAMCMAHRKKTFEKINDAIKNKRKVLCISTQVIEAGVDISFDSVVRLYAGMDNIVQAAGRCNRNAEKEISPVYIVDYNNEDLSKLKEIQKAKVATKKLVVEFKNNRERYNNDLTSVEAINYYYKALYRNAVEGSNEQDYCIGNNITLFDLLSLNTMFNLYDNEYVMHQAFKTAGQCFDVFDDESFTIMVPYGNGNEIITKLSEEGVNRDFIKMKSLIEQGKEFTISIMQYQKKKLEKEGAIYTICDGNIAVLNPNYYDENIGLNEGGNEECSIQIL